MISGFHRDVNEICALMACYAACSGNLPTYRDNLSDPYSSAKKNLLGFLTLEDRTYRLSRNVMRNYHYTLRNNPEERRSQAHSTSRIFQVKPYLYI